MKEYIGNSINISLVEMDNGAFRANAELIVVVSEPSYSISLGGEMIRQREVDHFRFAVTSRALRVLIKNLSEYADEMEKTEKHFESVTQSADAAA